MEKFFNECFKEVQLPAKEQGKDKKNKLDENIIKSPSDTTIYAPGLGKRLTPTTTKGVVYITQNMDQRAVFDNCDRNLERCD